MIYFVMQSLPRADNPHSALFFLLYFCIMSRNFTSLMLVLALICQASFSQYNQFELRGKTDVGLSISSGLVLAGGLYVKNNATPPLWTDVMNISTSRVNGFDRLVFDLPYKNRILLSDVVVGGLSVLPATLLFFPEAREDFFPLAVIFYQTAAFTYGLTTLAKGWTGRYRPYVYDASLTREERTEQDGGEAFFSGHTSGAAAMAFASASTLTAYVDSPVWDKVIWGVAITIPAYTGYLRMVSRKHFPTDVIVGYAVGASIGMLIPALHRVKREDSNITWHTGGSSFVFTCRF